MERDGRIRNKERGKNGKKKGKQEIKRKERRKERKEKVFGTTDEKIFKNKIDKLNKK